MSSIGLVWVVPLALAVGLILGALGGGGAILTVPILVYLMGQSPSSASAGSLVIVMLTSLVGALGHRRAGHVRLRDGLVFGGVGVVGSLVGSRASAAIQPAVLMTAFGVMMLVVAALMWRYRSGRSGGDGASRGVPTLVATATGVGFLTGFFGVGGGFAVVPALVLALGFSMPTAVGTSLVVIVVNSISALGARVMVGVSIDWPLILLFSVFGAVGSLMGGRVASRVAPRRLSAAFSVLLLGVGSYVLAMNVPSLL